jgi:ABC-type transport system involved in multi-copper enzyme maturation permease subunit
MMILLIPLAINSFKEIVRQPFYYVILFSGCLITLMSFAFTFFAFGEEARMIRDMGISTITISGLLAGCLSSSLLIANEFERQTTLAVLSKPITRMQFVLGKYMGIVAAATALIVFQGLVLEIALIINKYVKISSGSATASGLVDYVCLLGIYFALLQILILTAISLVLSIYLNMMANLTVCFLVFIFCHTFGYILPFHSNESGVASIIISICYAIFPNLQNLNTMSINEIDASTGLFCHKGIMAQYIGYNSLYCAVYCIAVVCIAVVIFKRKEVA